MTTGRVAKRGGWFGFAAAPVLLILGVPCLAAGGDDCPQLFGNPEFNVGKKPRFVGAFDLDSDGNLDLLSVNRLTDDISLLFNLGGGAFAIPTVRDAARSMSSVRFPATARARRSP